MARGKFRPIAWLIGLAFAAVLACGLILAGVYYLAQNHFNPQGFVDRDIVYQASDVSLKYVGFVNADGSANQTVFLNEGLIRPSWSPDGNTVYFIDPPSKDVPGGIDYYGYIAIWRHGQPIRDCLNADWFNITSIGTVASRDGVNVALLDRSEFWLLVDLDACKVIKQIKPPGDGKTIFSQRPSLSNDGNQIVYVQSTTQDQHTYVDSIAIMTIDTEETVSVTNVTVKFADSPSLSPDGRWITYYGSDGIHVVASDGSIDKLLDIYTYIDPSAGAAYSGGLPEPRWSPDSQWVVYHKCIDPKFGCVSVADYSIFKANIATGQDIKIIDHALYPNWHTR